MKDKGYKLTKDQLKVLPTPDDDGYHTIPTKYVRDGEYLKPIELLGKKLRTKEGERETTEKFEDESSESVIGLSLPTQQPPTGII